MRSTSRVLAVLAFTWAWSAGGWAPADAQQPQIPTLQVCNKTLVKGSGTVKIDSRVDAQSAGTIKVRIEVKCDPTAGTEYPTLGTLFLDFDLSDATKGTLTATTLHQLTSTGKHTPTAYMDGRCTMTGVPGCRYWLMVVDNRRASGTGTADVVSVLVFNGGGHRVAYGTGPLVQGDVDVADTGN